MKSVVEINILEQKLLIKSENGEERIKRVADYLNSKIEEVKKTSKVVSTLNIALLAAMNIADDCVEIKERLTKLEQRSRELSEFIDRRVD